MQVPLREVESPMYLSYEESVSLQADTYAKDTKLIYRFYSRDNLRYLKNRAGYFMRKRPEDEPRIDDLIDETYTKLCQHSEADGLMYKDDEDFQSYEGKIMKSVYQTDWLSTSDKGNRVAYSRQWEQLELVFEGKDDDSILDRTDLQQVEKGDGLESIFVDIPSLVDECKGEYADCGLSYVVVIGIMCIFRDLCASLKNTSEIQSIISPLLQSVLGLNESQVQYMYTDMRDNPNLVELIHEGFKEPKVLVGRIKNMTRCSLFFDKAEELVQERQYLEVV